LHVPGFVALYRNQPVVVARFGVPVPFSVAEVDVRYVAATVATIGADGVTNVTTAPIASPSPFCASAQ
jgi:hypothetical protein